MKRVYIFIVVGILSPFFLNSQCLKGNCQNGYGTFVFDSGAKYKGNFKNGNIFDFGTLYFRDGRVYSGQWKKLKRHGRGKLSFPDGSQYIGEFTENMRQGHGIMNFANGDKYDGAWKDDKMDGKGIYFHADGQKSEGSWSQGTALFELHPDRIFSDAEPNEKKELDSNIKDCNKMYCSNGVGKYTFLDGSYYEGEFKNGLPNGEGVCQYANGDRYEGEWKNNAPHGEGIMYFSDGLAYGAKWNAGYPVERIHKPNNLKKESSGYFSTTKTEFDKEVKIWAVIVGIAAYNHMPTLKYTDDDAYQVYAFLKSPEGGAIPDERISLLIDESATRKSILKAMESTFSKADKNDVIMLYYSGHGLPGSFLPIDFDGYNNVIEHHEIKDILEKSDAKHKICFADACHSGSLLAMKSSFNAARMKSFLDGFERAEAGTALFTSSKSEEISLEASGLRQGIYSHFLIRGLQGEADKNRDKIVTISELYEFVSRNVKMYTENRQNPVIAGNYDKNMPVAMLRD